MTMANLIQITGETIGEVRAVSGMHQRKAEMARQADAFIALPGMPSFVLRLGSPTSTATVKMVAVNSHTKFPPRTVPLVSRLFRSVTFLLNSHSFTCLHLIVKKDRFDVCPLSILVPSMQDNI